MLLFFTYNVKLEDIKGFRHVDTDIFALIPAAKCERYYMRDISLYCVLANIAIRHIGEFADRFHSVPIRDHTAVVVPLKAKLFEPF